MEIKVTRDLLDYYRKLKQEIPVLELELQMMKNTEAGLGNDTIFDYKTGYPRPQSIVGFDQPWTSGLMTSRMGRRDVCSECFIGRE